MASFTDSSTIDVNDDEDGDAEDANVDDELDDDTDETNVLDDSAATWSLVSTTGLAFPS